ncbi:MAG: NAD(P)/FAD-dependent oxidoreductase [Actinobacteria bacterium]|nr:NAD(P)/FAD-dependent oxidoreductase [Actinomycetota bacterium]
MSERYDLIVLGGGSAARAGAKKAAEDHGAKVALVESTRWGGSCPNVACKPTKAYLVAAELLHDVNRLADVVGIDIGPARADLLKVKARKDSLKKSPSAWVKDLNEQGFDTYEGEAELISADTVRIFGDEQLSGERILIATGSRTAIPPIEGIDDIDWLDHVSALDLTELPESLLVVGAGAVGLEFGQALARFGSRVLIVDAGDQLSPRSDKQAADELAAALEDEGIEVVLGSYVRQVAKHGAGIAGTIGPREGQGSREVRVAEVLLASGRAPNVEALNLDRHGIERHKLGIVVDEHMRTSVEGIWAAGDVTGLAQLTPIAQYQARIAADDMFGDSAITADYSVLPTTIFTDPEVAGVGLTEDEARNEGLDFEVVLNGPVQRAGLLEAKHVLYKLIYERESRRVRGIHVVARGAGDIVQGFSLAMKLGATVDDIAGMHHVYPTFGEGLKAAAEKAKPVPVKA